MARPPARPEIPVVNLAPWRGGPSSARDRLVATVDDAFRSVGFLVVTGHGVPPSLVRRMRAVTADFFALPDAAKRAVTTAPDRFRGYVGYGDLSSAHDDGVEAPPDLRESFTIGPVDRVPPPDAVGVEASNVWPAAPQGFAELWSEYYVAMAELAAEMMELFAVALDLDAGYFADDFDAHTSEICAAHYPPVADAVRGDCRVGPHHDFGGLTILQRDDAPGGLEVSVDDDWIVAPPVDDSFTLNLGDVMVRWTNGRWRSAVHRVALPPHDAGAAAHRMSIAFFHQPNPDARIGDQRFADHYAAVVASLSSP